MIESMVTTTDNPHSPFDDWDAWYAFDERSGYHTSSFLARVTMISSELSEVDQHLAIEQAVEEIVRENVLGIYIKVTREVPQLGA